MRIYDPRVGRFLSVDPITAQYPMLTPYQFASNTPIWATDLDGLEANFTNAKVKKLPYKAPDNPVLPFNPENPAIFLGNSAISAYNGVVDAVETTININPVYNVFADGAGYPKVYNDLKKTYNGVTNYLLFTPFEQQQKDYVSFLTNVSTYEEIVGAFMTERVIPKMGKVKYVDYNRTVALGSSEGVWGRRSKKWIEFFWQRNRVSKRKRL